MMVLVDRVKKDGFPKLKYLNLGGGLGIDYTRHVRGWSIIIIIPRHPKYADTKDWCHTWLELLYSHYIYLVSKRA